MKKTVLVLSAALSLSFAAAPVAFAQDAEPADCAAAVTNLNAADSAHRAAVDADKAAVDAREADQALRRAEDKLNDAQEAFRIAQADVTAKTAELERVKKAASTPPTEEQARDIRNAQTALDAAEETRKNAEVARNAAREARDDARVEEQKTDADALRDKANETDAAALKTELDEARRDFDRLCGGVTTTPAPDPDVDCDEVSDERAQEILNGDRSDPNNLDIDNDGIACEDEEILSPPAEDVVTPSGGISTGVGPA